jgi:hypothetical protein
VTASNGTAVTGYPAPDIVRYPVAALRFACAAWPMRAAEELRSALIFRALYIASRKAGATGDWLGRVASGVHDELRHARLCAEVGARFGTRPPKYDANPVRSRLARLPNPLFRAASLLLVELAIGETLSTYLFRAAYRAAREPLTRAALRSILGDEVRHQRLGWDALSSLWPALPEAQRSELQRHAAKGLAGCEQQTAKPAMLWLKERRHFDPAYAELGVLHPEQRVEAFYFAVERFVVPRLGKVGLDGVRAWELRYKV